MWIDLYPLASEIVKWGLSNFIYCYNHWLFSLFQEFIDLIYFILIPVSVLKLSSMHQGHTTFQRVTVQGQKNVPLLKCKWNLAVVFQSFGMSKWGWEILRNWDIFSVLAETSSKTLYVPSSSLKLNLNSTIPGGTRWFMIIISYPWFNLQGNNFLLSACEIPGYFVSICAYMVVLSVKFLCELLCQHLLYNIIVYCVAGWEQQWVFL